MLTSRMTEKKAKPKSLIKNVLLRITKLVFIFVSLGSLFAYIRISIRKKTQKLEEVKSYVSDRLQHHSSIFKVAENNMAILKKEFLQLYTSDLQVAEEEFWQYYFVDDQGATRMKRKFYDGVLTADGTFRYGVSSFIGNNQSVDDPDLQRRLIIAYKLVSQLGPAWQTEFINVHISFPENAIVIFGPQEEPWGLNAKADLPMNDLGVIKVTRQDLNPLRRSIWSGLYYDETAKEWRITYELPVDYQGKHLANPSHDMQLSDLLAKIVDDNLHGTYNFILRKDGFLIAHPAIPSEEHKYIGEISLVEADIPPVTRAYELIKETIGLDFTDINVIENKTDDNFLIVGKINGPDWIFVTVLPRSLVRKTAQSSSALVGGVGIVSLISTLSFVYTVLHNQVAKPLRYLCEAADDIGQGNYDAIDRSKTKLPIMLKNEMGLLANRFLDMAAHIKDNHHNLERIVNERTSELAKANEILKHMSSYDGLTQVYNRRSFDEDINSIFNQAITNGRVFSVLMADIDFFKLYNDTYGHSEGDEVLKKIANEIKDTIRDNDKVYRYGGEEFAIIFTDISIKSAQTAARRVINSIQELKIKHIKSPYEYLTISAGLQEYNNSFSNPQQLIKAADKKLYTAKNQGRNNLVL